MNIQKLRLGLLLDSFDIPAWLYHSLELIANSECAEFSLIIRNGGNQKDKSATWLPKLWRNRREFVYSILNRIDERIFVRGPNAIETKNLQKLLAGVPTITLRTIRDADIEVVKPDDVKIIREYDLDILIKLGFEQLPGELITTAKYGIWFYKHNDDRTERGGPPGFWEIVDNRSDTGAALLNANQFSQEGRAVYRSRFSTYRFSPARNRNISLWASSSFLPRQIDLLSRLGSARFFQETARFNSDFNFYDRRHSEIPSNLNSLKLYTRLFLRNISELYQRLFRLESWYLMFDYSKNTTLSFANFKKVVPPKDRFWADPHVIKKDDQYFIFIEEFIYKKNKGHISVIEMDLKGHYKDPLAVLEATHHLSYPFIFEYDNKYFMVPESAQNHSIDLYECVTFPTQWKFKIRLMDNVIARDSTLFFYLGKWWLFTGITENEGAEPEVELFLFYSDNLFSKEWKSHPLNPVISDVTCARPAGKLFTMGGKIFRPSQDCSKTYGYGFNINEVVCLSETDYREKMVMSVKPNWDSRLIATHTFTRVEGLNIIDALIRRSKLI
jgi:hypothetical protein